MGDDDLVVDVILLVVRLLDHVVGLGLGRGHLGSLRVLGELLLALLLLLVQDLDDDVADHADAEHDEHDVELHARAQVVAVGVGDDEARGLPQPVVAEGGLLVASEQRSVQPCNKDNNRTVVRDRKQSSSSTAERIMNRATASLGPR